MSCIEPLFDQIPSFLSVSQCLKIMEKVSFDIASEASYVYILSGQKFIKNGKNDQFWRVFEKCDFFGEFQTLCLLLKRRRRREFSYLIFPALLPPGRMSNRPRKGIESPLTCHIHLEAQVSRESKIGCL